MDPFSQFLKTHQDQDQAMLAFSPLFTPTGSSGFASAANYQQQHVPIQELGTFSFPINPHNDKVLLQQEIFPNSTHLDRYFYNPWDADHELLINPQPAVLPQQTLLPEAAAADTAAAAEEMLKRKHHNASERMRRKRLNGLFAALSSVLPGADQMKKQTAPSTVERVIKYIPQLREEVETLLQRKQGYATPPIDVVLPQLAPPALAWSVEATDLGNGAISALISIPKSLISTFIPISEVLRLLEEEDGLVVLDVSSSESSARRLFYHIHLMEEGTHTIDSELLRTKLFSSCQKWEETCLWMITRGT